MCIIYTIIITIIIGPSVRRLPNFPVFSFARIYTYTRARARDTRIFGDAAVCSLPPPYHQQQYVRPARSTFLPLTRTHTPYRPYAGQRYIDEKNAIIVPPPGPDATDERDGPRHRPVRRWRLRSDQRRNLLQVSETYLKTYVHRSPSTDRRGGGDRLQFTCPCPPSCMPCLLIAPA